MADEVYQATKEVPEMSVKDAIVHLHNFAHSQLSPLVLLGAVKRAEQMVAEGQEAEKQLSILRQQQELLRRGNERLALTKDELSKAVEELTQRHAAVSKMLSEAVSEMTGSGGEANG